jgi:hypothetical protein
MKKKAETERGKKNERDRLSQIEQTIVKIKGVKKKPIFVFEGSKNESCGQVPPANERVT